MTRQQRPTERALTRLDRRVSDRSEAEVKGDPITVGPDRSITVDVMRLAPPSNVYDADYAWIEHSARAVSLFFGKRNRDDPSKLRTRLELRYPAENLESHLWKNSRTFHERLKEYVAKWRGDDLRGAIDPSKMASSRDHSEWANFQTMAHAGSEACIDFYQMSPIGLAHFAKGRGSGLLRFAPVVRVQLTVFEIVNLLDAAEAAVQRLAAEVPAAVRASETELVDDKEA